MAEEQDEERDGKKKKKTHWQKYWPWYTAGLLGLGAGGAYILSKWNEGKRIEKKHIAEQEEEDRISLLKGKKLEEKQKWEKEREEQRNKETKEQQETEQKEQLELKEKREWEDREELEKQKKYLKKTEKEEQQRQQLQKEQKEYAEQKAQEYREHLQKIKQKEQLKRTVEFVKMPKTIRELFQPIIRPDYKKDDVISTEEAYLPSAKNIGLPVIDKNGNPRPYYGKDDMTWNSFNFLVENKKHKANDVVPVMDAFSGEAMNTWYPLPPKSNDIINYAKNAINKANHEILDKYVTEGVDVRGTKSSVMNRGYRYINPLIIRSSQ